MMLSEGALNTLHTRNAHYMFYFGVFFLVECFTTHQPGDLNAICGTQWNSCCVELKVQICQYFAFIGCSLPYDIRGNSQNALLSIVMELKFITYYYYFVCIWTAYFRSMVTSLSHRKENTQSQ